MERPTVIATEAFGASVRADIAMAAEKEPFGAGDSENSDEVGANSELVLATNEVDIQDLIHMMRGVQVMLDRDLAMLYQVETKNLNRAAKRNEDRFPGDFRFQLTKEETEILRCQFGTSKNSIY